jgi:hypothetical protein
MKTITKITIPQPCHEQWQNMTDAQGGRYCNSCAKTVVDFTLMSNEQIIDYLTNTNNVCGRISTPQFNSVNQQLNYINLPKAGLWKRMILAVSMMASTIYAKGQATPVKAETTQMPSSIPLGKVIVPVNVNYRTITGSVADSKGEPLIGVVVIAGNNRGTTDIHGNFRVTIPVKTKKIRIAYIGFETQEINVKQNEQQAYKIVLKESAMMLGGLGAVKKQSLLKRFYQENIVQPFKALLA